jgi:hypothetical protein
LETYCLPDHAGHERQMPDEGYVIRKATAADAAVLSGVIAKSARGLSADYYESEEVEAAFRGAFGVDSQLVDDGTPCSAAMPSWCGIQRNSIRPRADHPIRPHAQAEIALSYFIDFTCATN